MAEVTSPPVDLKPITNTRDLSPNSVILTFESNFTSLFSSASASVDRCSFASDTQDHDFLTSQLYQHFPDLNVVDLNKSALQQVCRNNNTRFGSKNVEKAKVYQEENKKLIHNHLDLEIDTLDSARYSFSQALKECQERKSRSEALNKKSDRRRPVSLDLNSSSGDAINVVSSSPKLGGVMNNVTARKSGNFPSPGTPNYHHGNVVIPKGWSSERVPLPSNGYNRRQSGVSLLPLSNNGKGLPSKWEDAERWICSPVSLSSTSSSYQQPLRRPKSKSGPLGPPGIAYHSLYSPAAPMYEGEKLRNHMAESPITAGGMMADAWSFRVSAESRGFDNVLEPSIARSVSVHGCTDLICHDASLISSQDERVDATKDAATNVSRAVSRRDMATQMSPEGSCHSSPRRSSFSSFTPSILPIVEVQSIGPSKPEVRDVQIDERVTVTQWSKKYRGQNPSKEPKDVDEWKSKAVDPRSSALEASETVKSLSKNIFFCTFDRARRDEAKITAWENLQKAKAEAAIRKLEMKLEKKRSLTMDKIMKKLRSAQKNAQEMRSTILTNQTHQVSKENDKAMFFRTRRMGLLSGCFRCHAF
ncbi:uncharacterized protein LOC130798049 isoform X2 [Amaranthus tricolor]|uniref:uncharacterized protein LOC130798049 isoform X2 n=1 Tax=Amaranthus tricolor TaxID=29722 RepID=UPI00258552AD|nr:uncharacterized protein LOC130798049 isoform X2 [Amaranthus tricolor]